MSLTFAYQATGSRTNTSNISSCTSNAFTAAAGKLHVCFLIFTDGEATAEVPSSVALDGSTPPVVTQISGATPAYNTVAAPLNRMTAWWFIGDGVSRTLTATNPDAGTGYIWYIVEVTDADPDNPIVQSASGTGDAGTTASATLATFKSENNAALICVSTDTTSGISAEAGGAWTELNADISFSTPATRASAASRSAGTDTSPTMTIAGASDWGCIAVEIRENTIAFGARIVS